MFPNIRNRARADNRPSPPIIAQALPVAYTPAGARGG